MASEFNERRHHPRYPCDTGVQFYAEKATFGSWGTVSDISLSGCYVYTFAPLATGQIVTLIIEMRETEVDVCGRIVSSHPGVGMGVEFTHFIHEDGEERLKSYLAHLANPPKPNDSLPSFT